MSSVKVSFNSSAGSVLSRLGCGWPTIRTGAPYIPFFIGRNITHSSHVRGTVHSKVLSFDDPAVAYKNKSLFELALAITIFKMCSFRPFVTNGHRLLGFFSFRSELH